jgi:hypothetical protein
MADEQASACTRALGEATKAYAFCETSKGKVALAKLADLRNKVIAHTLTVALGALPSYDELFQLTDVARDVCGPASLAVLGRAIELKDYEERMIRAATEFWHPAIGALSAPVE